VGTTATRRNSVVLVCEVCGERTVLEGPLAVWHSGRTTFSCECGRRLTLADRPEPTEPTEQQPKKEDATASFRAAKGA
jgi:hypothetical protein